MSAKGGSNDSIVRELDAGIDIHAPDTLDDIDDFFFHSLITGDEEWVQDVPDRHADEIRAEFEHQGTGESTVFTVSINDLSDPTQITGSKQRIEREDGSGKLIGNQTLKYKHLEEAADDEELVEFLSEEGTYEATVSYIDNAGEDVEAYISATESFTIGASEEEMPEDYDRPILMDVQYEEPVGERQHNAIEGTIWGSRADDLSNQAYPNADIRIPAAVSKDAGKAHEQAAELLDEIQYVEVDVAIGETELSIGMDATKVSPDEDGDAEGEVEVTSDTTYSRTVEPTVVDAENFLKTGVGTYNVEGDDKKRIARAVAKREAEGIADTGRSPEEAAEAALSELEAVGQYHAAKFEVDLRGPVMEAYEEHLKAGAARAAGVDIGVINQLYDPGSRDLLGEFRDDNTATPGGINEDDAKAAQAWLEDEMAGGLDDHPDTYKFSVKAYTEGPDDPEDGDLDDTEPYAVSKSDTQSGPKPYTRGNVFADAYAEFREARDARENFGNMLFGERSEGQGHIREDLDPRKAVPGLGYGEKAARKAGGAVKKAGGSVRKAAG